MNKKLQKLSDAEWIIMKICWERGESTAREIYEEAIKKKAWEYRTVKTMLDRLAKKEYLKCEKLGTLCVFKPCVSNSSTIGEAIENFVNTILDNNFVPIFAHFAKGKKIPPDDLESLKKMIAEYEQQNDSE